MKQIRRMLSVLLCIALVLSGLVVPAKDVQAEETTKTIAGLGTSIITDPIAPGEDTTQPWSGSYVYFGNYDADGDETAEPVKYRVLDASTTEFGGTTMLLDCDSILYYTPFDGAKVLDYQKLNVDSFSTSGTGTCTLPDSLANERMGLDYYAYIVAEDVNGEKETDYASTPVAISWETPVVKAMNFGLQGIIDPAIPNSNDDAWKGCYVYFGNYDGSPVKYRVLDASTTEYSADQTTQTMLLDCDSVLYKTSFDDGEATSEGATYANDWSFSELKNSLNKDGGFIDTAFSPTEKSAIAASTKTAASTLDGDGRSGLSYTPLNGERIFLPDAKEATRITYGYSDYYESVNRVKKFGNTAVYRWLRSAHNNQVKNVGCVWSDGYISNENVSSGTIGVSPALNLNRSSILLSSVSGTGKSSALTSKSNEIDVTTDTDWKLTLLDTNKSIALIQDRMVIKASDGTITVPYTYTDSAAGDSEKVNQISVMLTDKAYGSENAQILYYGALQNIKNAEGTDAAVAETSAGTGTFALPSDLTGTEGKDYHIYLLAEHVSEGNASDYASAPLEIEVMTPIAGVNISNIDVPNAGKALVTEIEVTGEGVDSKASVTWKKGGEVASGNAEGNTTYQAYVTLTPLSGFIFVDETGEITNVTMNGKAVDSKKVILNEDGTLTVDCGEFAAVLSDDKDTDSNKPVNGEVTVSGAKMTVKDDGTAAYVAPLNGNVATITIPDTINIKGKTYRVTSIEKNAFRNSKIKKIVIGSNIKTIGKNAFYGCKKLTTVKMGKNVTTIGAKAFYRCTALKKITIPSKVKKIGKKAFYGCSKLKTLTIKTTKLTTKRVGSKVFGKTPKNMTVKIPKKKFKAYKSMLIKKGVNKKAKFKKR